jgi:peptidoglycan hydrolase-like protein with peptidoglycan-binding domain
MPGKRTLVEAVQQRAGGEPPEQGVHAAAEQGAATPTSPLPYGDKIQRSFGRHDISSVQAHTGAEAGASAKSMGADAYAAGEHVVLGKSDLHTVAHEAAHVVQQRGGVQLKGGVGQAGDAYEQHADAVADKVVAGESAESLLSTKAGSGGGSPDGAVQHTKDAATPAHDGEHDEQNEHEEHEAGDEKHEDAQDLADGETAPQEAAAAPQEAAAASKAAPTHEKAAPTNEKAAQTGAPPVQMKSSTRSRALGAVLMKRAGTSRKRPRGYRAAPSLAAVRAGSASLRRGMAGSAVKFVQQHVNAHPDTMFGPHTQAAVRKFQHAHNLIADGIVGPHTIAAIDHGSPAHAGSGTHAGSGAHDGGGHPTGTEEHIRDQVIAKARNHMGARYSWAAEGPSMFDCSGFAWYVLHTDMHLTGAGRTTAAGLAHSPYTTPTSSPQKGDLVFYSSGGISHVTIALGQGSEVIGASGGGQNTHGKDPNARVKLTDWNHDRRHKTFGSIRGLINHKGK